MRDLTQHPRDLAAFLLSAATQLVGNERPDIDSLAEQIAIAAGVDVDMLPRDRLMLIRRCTAAAMCVVDGLEMGSPYEPTMISVKLAETAEVAPSLAHEQRLDPETEILRDECMHCGRYNGRHADDCIVTAERDEAGRGDA
jgi:hypothetical protein